MKCKQLLLNAKYLYSRHKWVEVNVGAAAVKCENCELLIKLDTKGGPIYSFETEVIDGIQRILFKDNLIRISTPGDIYKIRKEISYCPNVIITKK